MFLPQALESFLGNIETWPTNIINHLFIDEPSPTTIKKVTSSYGNNVPFHIASYFYKLCNQQWGNFVSDIMQTFYFIWQSARYSSHLSIYYNTSFKRYMWINGKGLIQIEPFIPNLSGIQLGVEETGYPLLIHVKLRLNKRDLLVCT